MLSHNMVLSALLLVSILVGTSAAKPKLKVADDGFPTGQSTPEGAASDLTRAFMRQDITLFRSVCIRPFGGGQLLSEYTGYLNGIAVHFKQGKALATTLPDNPKRITKVFAARHLSKNGPASYGYAAFDFQDVMFVDVEVILNNGSKLMRRTLVIKDRDGKWYTLPVFDVSPLLSDGIDEESASVRSFSDVYDVEK